MYAGQGSQYYQMGADLYANHKTFKAWMDKLDQIAQQYGGKSIVGVIYNPTNKISESFDEIEYTHPAIFMVGYSLTQVLLEMGITPDYVLGTSLGEYIALAVSGACSYQKVLEIIIKESNLLKQRNSEGGMLAVLASKEVFLQHPEAFGKCELAADNFKGHFVLSGSTADIQQASVYLEAQQITFQKLPISYAFHSAYINAIEQEFKQALQGVSFQPPTIPIISCAYKAINPALTAQYLWDIIRLPIRFADTLAALHSPEDFLYIDLGASSTLTTFINYNLVSSRHTYSILSPYGDVESRLKKLQGLAPTPTIYTTSNIPKETNKMKAYVFPGQGSQKKGMGAGLFDEFKEITQKADKILGYSIQELCLEDPQKQLVQTQYAQVAIYIVNALHYYKKLQSSRKPDFVAGHSLGEYNALLAAGVFDFETGLRLVQKRGLLMAQAAGGGMAAVGGLSEGQILQVLKENQLDSIDVANYNSPDQIVLSGTKLDILKAQPFLENAGASLFIPLPVSGAFHSRYMQASSDEFGAFLDHFQFNTLQIPVISNVSARPYTNSSVKENLTRQIVSSVKWTESIRYLMGKGEIEFVEVGESTVLTKLITAIKTKATPLYIQDESVSSLEEAAVNSRANYSVLINPERLNENGYVKENGSAVGSNGNGISTSAAIIKDKVIRAEDLGAIEYKKAYNVKYAYATGSMYKGIASSKMVIAMAKAGMMTYFGAAGLSLATIEKEIRVIKAALGENRSFGINLIHNLYNPEKEEEVIDLYLKHQIKHLEASAFMQVSKALVKFRLKGLKKGDNGEILSGHRIQAKISRPEVAEFFLSPAPDRLVKALLATGEITPEQAELATQVPVATEICVESDSGGHTDRGISTVLIPAIVRLRDEMANKYNYKDYISVGAAGGIGTPEAAASAFLLGADYIVTGSINQCTVEAETSISVKNMLEKINVQDTDYAPAGDMFELGAKVQVVRKGIFFPARANILFELYKQHNSLDEIEPAVRTKLEKTYFKKTITEIYQDCKAYYSAEEIEKAEKNPKYRMALIFKWYFGFSSRAALTGDENNTVNYQVHCGSALGAFNQWVKESDLKNWQNRNVDTIAIKLLTSTAEYLTSFYKRKFL
jgi:trans-AT polyketide synthase/acyltransferase/oxidoreductase domain-containing protein